MQLLTGYPPVSWGHENEQELKYYLRDMIHWQKLYRLVIDRFFMSERFGDLGKIDLLSW